MKNIPVKFTKYGDTFKLLECRYFPLISEAVAIYSRTNNNRTQYEVMYIREYQQDYDMCNVKRGDLRFPTSNEWGRYGWTYNTVEEAINKLNKICLEKS